ncbi:MAG: RluA family pseudouridine synthase [Acholeplasmataceae bacterium]|jgi:23S rRNA pseudouridine1911/1915/1917 synthase|nr:RluA family pseudouridine synthase [Acholeplasmataceae bacterium]
MNQILVKKINHIFDGYTIEAYLSHFHLARKTRFLLSLGQIKVHGDIVKNDVVLHENDELEIDFSSLSKAYPKAFDTNDIDIIYEDDDLLIVDKPSGLLVYDDGQNKDNLTGRVAHYYQKKGYLLPVLPVHRIDEETSGMIIYAKHPLALSYMSYLFESKQIKKVYQCLVSGHLKEKKATLIKRVAQDRHTSKMIVSKNGDEAITSIEVLDVRDQISRLSVRIETGRKHQIRVHLSDYGYPIIGDKLYQGVQSERLMLHFTNVSFVHPSTKEMLDIHSKVPF